MKTNRFGTSTTTTKLKQEAMGYIHSRGRGGTNGYQNNQMGGGNQRGRNSFLRGNYNA